MSINLLLHSVCFNCSVVVQYLFKVWKSSTVLLTRTEKMLRNLWMPGQAALNLLPWWSNNYVHAWNFQMQYYLPSYNHGCVVHWTMSTGGDSKTIENLQVMSVWLWPDLDHRKHPSFRWLLPSPLHSQGSPSVRQRLECAVSPTGSCGISASQAESFVQWSYPLHSSTCIKAIGHNIRKGKGSHYRCFSSCSTKTVRLELALTWAKVGLTWVTEGQVVPLAMGAESWHEKLSDCHICPWETPCHRGYQWQVLLLEVELEVGLFSCPPIFFHSFFPFFPSFPFPFAAMDFVLHPSGWRVVAGMEVDELDDLHGPGLIWGVDRAGPMPRHLRRLQRPCRSRHLTKPRHGTAISLIEYSIIRITPKANVQCKVMYGVLFRTLGESANLFGRCRSMRVFSTLSIPKYYQRYEAMLGYATCVIHLLARQLTQKETRWQHQMRKMLMTRLARRWLTRSCYPSGESVLWSMCPCTSWTCWTGPWSPFPPCQVLQPHPMTRFD